MLYRCARIYLRVTNGLKIIKKLRLNNDSSNKKWVVLSSVYYRLVYVRTYIYKSYNTRRHYILYFIRLSPRALRVRRDDFNRVLIIITIFIIIFLFLPLTTVVFTAIFIGIVSRVRSYLQYYGRVYTHTHYIFIHIHTYSRYPYRSILDWIL